MNESHLQSPEFRAVAERWKNITLSEKHLQEIQTFFQDNAGVTFSEEGIRKILVEHDWLHGLIHEWGVEGDSDNRSSLLRSFAQTLLAQDWTSENKEEYTNFLERFKTAAKEKGYLNDPANA